MLFMLHCWVTFENQLIADQNYYHIVYKQIIMHYHCHYQLNVEKCENAKRERKKDGKNSSWIETKKFNLVFMNLAKLAELYKS